MFLTYDQAVVELQKAVAERGEGFTYPEDWKDSANLCQYAISGRPACIVGKVFHQLGVSIVSLEGRAPDPRGAGTLVGVEMDDDTAVLLHYAQDMQDKGFTWGEAYGFALAEATRIREAHVPC